MRRSCPDLEGAEASPDGSSQPSSIETLSRNFESATELTRLLRRTLGDLGLLVLGDLALILPLGDFGRIPRVDVDT